MYDKPAYRWADPIWRDAAETWIHEIVARVAFRLRQIGERIGRLDGN